MGAGIFFIGYFLFEVPSNIILHRTGARRWIARIMVTWGVLSACTMFVTTPMTFYVLRFFLGVFEAGFFPGIILYLTYWFPITRRGKVVALFMTAIALAGVIGGPVSGWIMQSFNGMNGWAGWQWLFLLEGIPSVIVGIWVLFYLDDSIKAAKWLQPEEKRLLEQRIAEDGMHKADHGIAGVFRNGKVWLCAAIYFCFIMGLYGVSFWLPQLIKSMGVKEMLDVGLLTMIPYGFAAVVMVLAGRNSDRTGERRWHAATAASLGGLGLILAGLITDSASHGHGSADSGHCWHPEFTAAVLASAHRVPRRCGRCGRNCHHQFPRQLGRLRQPVPGRYHPGRHREPHFGVVRHRCKSVHWRRSDPGRHTWRFARHGTTPRAGTTNHALAGRRREAPDVEHRK